MTDFLQRPARDQELRKLYSQLVHMSQDEGYTEEALKTVKGRDKKRS